METKVEIWLAPLFFPYPHTSTILSIPLFSFPSRLYFILKLTRNAFFAPCAIHSLILSHTTVSLQTKISVPPHTIGTMQRSPTFGTIFALGVLAFSGAQAQTDSSPQPTQGDSTAKGWFTFF